MLRTLLVAALCVVAIAAQEKASEIEASAYQDLRYRLVGPFRASRTVAGVGIPTEPSVFFVGVHTGGVWKTDDYGRTWRPIFDSAPTGSIGDVGVSQCARQRSACAEASPCQMKLTWPRLTSIGVPCNTLVAMSCSTP